ncbi:HD-GYP domain-containing protein [Halalkalibacter nanhaiisediminis]|uniref:HD-GYP domain-containing protein (C-di-GMP phosphodiesterase class II) n=1 Tax=Halalkalibacter nanhaiisediminis TaxID=688079 RepID=A0A562QTG7_9BACI|nr:HD-GYP domain-containing protein [Halalkalibacter nanhaiisediminis]TWI60088.1 HD-GYP domain-containing protein (c-di-GMP phosphodiesterase class II) [Halalkalibacter nanhaiisediminis]
MRLVATRSLSAGTKLGKPIYNDNGQILLRQGVVLTERVITRLSEMGISFVYIEDARTEGIDVADIVTDETKRMAVKTIKEEFLHIGKEIQLKKVFNGDHLSKDFSKIVQAILSDIKSNEEALALLSDVYVYDNYIFTHSLNVTVYTLGLAVDLGFNEKQLIEIGMGALLHDVGKLSIPAEILNKPGRLTDEEFAIIKTHAKAGFDMLRRSPNISLLTAHCALQHHERLDGTGYPQGLIDENIHIYAKIIGIADVFDAVTSNRVYRKPMLPHEALELLYAGVGTQFDHTLIDAFRRTIAVYPVGLTVTLSDGRIGIVIKQNKELSTHPVVRIISEDGEELESPYDLDLTKQLNVTIVETESTLAESMSS